MAKIAVASWTDLADRTPTYALVGTVDLVVTRFDDQVSVLYGRCLHRGALMADGSVEGDNLICGLHGWDYRLDTGVSEYNNQEVVPKFRGWVEEESVCVDEAAQRLARYFTATVELMEVMARACGHHHLNQFAIDDLTTFDRQMSDLTGIAYGGVKGR